MFVHANRDDDCICGAPRQVRPARIVGLAFEGEIDYAMLAKLDGPATGGEGEYTPSECIGCKREPIAGEPDPDHISTSFAGRQNPTMRMHMRRLTRLTNASSRKIESLEHAVALHSMHYNFARRHQTLRITPAMATGVDRHLGSIEEIVGLIGRAALAPRACRNQVGQISD